MNVPAHLFDMTLPEGQASLARVGQPAWRARQLFEWLYCHRARHWQQMTSLPASLRQQMDQWFVLYRGQPVKIRRSLDGTSKLLIQWGPDEWTETVLMHENGRNTVCVSTQIGCAVGCVFCASGRGGLQRSLTAGEIVEQVMHAAALLPQRQRISHVVLMGMGEPFANYDASIRAMRILNASWGLGVAARHLTVSTIGIPDKIRQLADEPEQFTLAVSLHAPDDDLRARLIPWAPRYPIRDIFAAIDDYYSRTHREVTLEYILLDGINADLRHADRLARLIGASRCNVNAINYNATPDSPYRPVSAGEARAFIEALRARGVNAHLRKSKGEEIDAACGQLRQNQAAGSREDKS